jgi:hypothetical protein
MATETRIFIVNAGDQSTLAQVKCPGAKQTYQTDHDQINGHDIVQELGHEQYENPCDERDQGCQSNVKVHKISKVIESKNTRLQNIAP